MSDECPECPECPVSLGNISDSLAYFGKSLAYAQLKTKKPWNPIYMESRRTSVGWVGELRSCVPSVFCTATSTVPIKSVCHLWVQSNSEDSSWLKTPQTSAISRAPRHFFASLQRLKLRHWSVPQPQPRTWSLGIDFGFGAEGPCHIMSCHWASKVCSLLSPLSLLSTVEIGATVFFASHRPQLQLSAESNGSLSASQNETELGNLAAPWSFWLNHGVGGKDQIIKQGGRNRSKRSKKGV